MTYNPVTCNASQSIYLTLLLIKFINNPQFFNYLDNVNKKNKQS